MYDRYSVRRLLVTAGVIAAAGFSRLLFSRLPYHGFGLLIFAVYLLIGTEWLFSIRRRFLQREIRRHMTAFAAMMLALLVLTTVRYHFVPENSFLSRQLWYWYYVPLMNMPPLMLLSAWCIGLPDTYSLPRKRYGLFLPFWAVMLGIITNDRHQLAFRFDEAAQRDTGYTYGPLYYLAAGVLAIGVIGTLYAAFRACLHRRYLRHFWLPLTVTVCGAVYWVVYITAADSQSNWLLQMYSMPEAVCWFSICFWESLVCVHLIPSNSNHRHFFEASSLNAGLTDKNYRVRLSAPHSIIPQPEQVQQAETTPVLLDDGTTLLKSYQVRGGNFYWMEDLSEMIRLNEKLADTEDYLTEENAMLDAATAIEEGKKTFSEQNRLYDEIEKKIKPQLDKVNDIIDNLPEEETAFVQQMKRAGILNAYIKRYSNLLLIAGANEAMEVAELGMALAESLEYVRLADLQAVFSSEGSGYIRSEFALLLFELYESMLESALPGAQAVLVTLNVKDGVLSFWAEIAAPSRPFDAAPFRKRAGKAGAVLQAFYEEDCESVSVKAYMGGDDR